MGVENFQVVNTTTVSTTVVSGSASQNNGSFGHNQVGVMVLPMPVVPAERGVVLFNRQNGHFAYMARDFFAIPNLSFDPMGFFRAMAEYNFIRALIQHEMLRAMLESQLVRTLAEIARKALLLDMLKALLARSLEKDRLRREIEKLQDEIDRSIEQAMDDRIAIAALTASIVA